MSRVGIVTTFRFVPFVPREGTKGNQGEYEATATLERCWSTLNSFLLFHLSKGIEHVFLYADANDGSNDVYIERIAAAFSKSLVSVDVRNDLQRKRQQATCRLWDQLGPFSATEVPARQSLNAEDALRKAGEMGLDWLCHLDIDELLFTSEPSIRPHFDRLNALGVEQMTYANHEAVPLREDIGDYFREVNTFKINHLLLPLSHGVGERSRFWRRRTSHGQYMLAYDNGKSAVRVLPGRIVPQSVHRWRTLKSEERHGRLHAPTQNSGVDVMSALEPPKGGGQDEAKSASARGHNSAASLAEKRTGEAQSGGGTEDLGAGQGKSPPAFSSDDCDQLVNRVAMADPRELIFDEVLECSDPCILHYPSCGLDWFRDKYRLLGSFPSSWFDGRLPIAPCFHLDARDAMHQGQGKEGPRDDGDGARDYAERDGNSLRGLYHKEVMLCPDEHSEEMQAQLDHGVLRVIGGPARTIEEALDARECPRSVTRPQTRWDSIEELEQGREAKEDGKSGQDGSPRADVEKAGKPTLSSSKVAGFQAADGGQPSAFQSEKAKTVEDLRTSSGLDNAWILAACTREYL